MTNFQRKPIPALAGVGLKPQHFQSILAQESQVSWFEIHAENYMSGGGLFHHYLRLIREKYPLSIHGVGLSLGSYDGLCHRQLNDLKILVERYQPGLVSEHLSWSRYGEHHLNDLLPMPYTKESLNRFVANISQAQDVLKKQILIENPSSYFELNYNEYSENEFMVAIAQQAGCQILLDVNNVYVSAKNHGFDAKHYIDSIPPSLVGEIHLAGHSVQSLLSGEVRIDDHGSMVSDDVWRLYQYTLNKIGARPTLIEWDTNVPDWEVLSSQAAIAHQFLIEIPHSEVY
jgi:uncharacterized protein (UPF0276 family)